MWTSGCTGICVRFLCVPASRLFLADSSAYILRCSMFCVYISGYECRRKKRVNEKKGSTDRIWAKKPEVVKGNESIPVSLQPLSRIIAVVFFSGWEMPKRTAQTKRLPLLLFYYNISFLTIPCLSLSQASPLRVRQRKRFFIERKKGCHLGDKREKWWHYDVPVMLIKIRKSVHSAMSQIQNNNLLC